MRGEEEGLENMDEEDEVAVLKEVTMGRIEDVEKLDELVVSNPLPDKLQGGMEIYSKSRALYKGHHSWYWITGLGLGLQKVI